MSNEQEPVRCDTRAAGCDNPHVTESPWAKLRQMTLVVLPPIVAILGALWIGYGSVTQGELVDISVYREAASTILAGGSPYATGDFWPWVYPPAGVFLALLAAVGPTVHVAETLWVVVSLAALARTFWLLVAQAWPKLSRGATFRRTCWLFAVACVLEPTYHVLSLGQVGLILLWLTVEGLCGVTLRPARSVLVGVAISIKLTPALVLVALAGAGRWRAVAWVVVGFVAATTVAALVFPATARGYIDGGWRLAEEANHLLDAQNHSLPNIAAMLGLPRLVGLAVAVVLGVFGTATAVVLWRSGDELAGTAAILVAILLASPVSWTHHWVAAYPALVVLLRDLKTRRMTAAPLLLLSVLAMFVWFDRIGDSGVHILRPGDQWPWWNTLQREWWLIWGLLFLFWVQAPNWRRWHVVHRAER